MATDDDNLSDEVAEEQPADIDSEEIDESAESGKKSGRRKKKAGNRTTPALFMRQVVAELRKVIWPTRSELITYTTVSVVFIVFVMVAVFGIDQGLQRLVFKLFA